MVGVVAHVGVMRNDAMIEGGCSRAPGEKSFC